MTEDEEFEFRHRMEMEQAQAQAQTAPADTFSVPSRPKVFNEDQSQPARMTNAKQGMRDVPTASPRERALYEAGGLATDALTKAGLPPEAAAAGGYATNLAGQVATTFLGGGLGAKAEPAVQAIGKGFMKSALKPTPLQIESGAASRVADTMLREGKLVSRGDIEAMTKDINGLNTQIMSAIQNSPETVNKIEVAKYAQRAFDKWKNQVNSATDVKAVRDSISEFLNDKTIAMNMPASVAQKLKQGTYRSLGEKAYGTNNVQAAVDTQKDLAYGLKEELAAKHPGIADANARESDLIQARKMAERALAKSESRDQVGFGWLSNHPSAAIGWMAERSPWLKSMMAHYLHSHADPEMAGRAVGAAAGAYSGSSNSRRLSDEK